MTDDGTWAHEQAADASTGRTGGLDGDLGLLVDVDWDLMGDLGTREVRG